MDNLDCTPKLPQRMMIFQITSTEQSLCVNVTSEKLWCFPFTSASHYVSIIALAAPFSSHIQISYIVPTKPLLTMWEVGQRLEVPEDHGAKPLISKHEATANPMSSPEQTDNSRTHQDNTSSSTLQHRVRSLTSALGSPLEAPPPTSRHGRQRESEDDWTAAAVRRLDSSQPLSERRAGAEFVGAKIKHFSVDALAAVWMAAEDLFSKDAPLELRDIGFTLLLSSIQHTSLGLSERMKLYRMATVPVDASHAEEQFQVLKTLTENGHNLKPFARPFIGILSHSLEDMYKATLKARKRLAPSKKGGNRPRLPEEKGLYALLSLINNIILSNSDAVDGNELDIIVQNAIQIVRMSPSEREMKEALSVINAVTLDLMRPIPHIEPCVEVLSAIHGSDILTSSPKGMAWQSLLDLLRSTQGATVTGLLFRIVSSNSEAREASCVRGAVSMLVHLVCVDGSADLPSISIPQLYKALENTDDSRMGKHHVLRIISKFLEIPEFTQHLLERDQWGPLLDEISRTIIDCDFTEDGDTSPTLRGNPSSSTSLISAQLDRRRGSKVANDAVDELRMITRAIVPSWPQMSYRQQTAAGAFFYKIRNIIPLEAEELMIVWMIRRRMIFPGADDWVESLSRLVNDHLVDNRRQWKARELVLEVMKDVVPVLSSEEDHANFREIVFRFLRTYKVQPDEDVQIIEGIADFVTSYSQTADVDVDDFTFLLQSLWPLLSVQDTTMDNPTPQLTANPVTLHMLRFFIESFQLSAQKTTIAYDKLIDVAKSRNLPTSTRLPAILLLARLRCNTAHAIYTIPQPDSLGLTSAILPSGALPSQADPASLNDEQAPTRVGRASTVSQRGPEGSRASTQSANRLGSTSQPTIPLWVDYERKEGLERVEITTPGSVIYQHTRGADERTTLRLSNWLAEMIDILQQTDDWDIYSYIVVHLPSQLSNPTLFSNAVPHICLLRSVIVSQLKSGTIREPSANTGVKKGDVALCLFNSLIMLLGYSEHFSRAEQDDIVRTLLAGISSWDRVTKVCIQGLSICCHVVPQSLTRSLSAILQKMSQIITQSHLAVDMLEFLAGLARLPDVYVNLTEHELRTVFAICIRHLQHLRDQRQKQADQVPSHAANRMSGLSGESGTASSRIIDIHTDLPQYVFALAYHVLTIWFLSLRLVDRAKHVGSITSNLTSKDSHGQDVLEEQSQVSLDMMHRTAYLDLGETEPCADFSPSDGKILKKTWLLGLSIVTVETAAATGLTHLIKRQASGTTHATYQLQTAPLPLHHVAAPTDAISSVHGPESRLNVFPNHVFLQLTSTIAPTPSPMEAICLPDDEATRRAISAFDRNDTVDGYKVGVVYIGYNQSHEAEILANDESSPNPAFNQFLEGLGTKVPLKGAAFNTQGLDKELDTDGTHTYAWRDRITEIVFHIPTLMPTDLENDPHCISKKRHVGNDHVNIIFNDSGLPFVFDTIPSQFNYVNIVITPEPSPAPVERGEADDGARTLPEKQQYFTVRTYSHPTFPQISPVASCRLLSLTNLPGLVRQIALNASVFSNVWAHREGGEHVSSWRNRLREIKKLRARFAGTGTSASERYPGAKGSKTYVEGDQFRGTVAMGGLAEEDGIVSGLDFSRWAGPNPPLG